MTSAIAQSSVTELKLWRSRYNRNKFSGFFVVEQPLIGYKKVYGRPGSLNDARIAKLELVPGSMLYIDGFRFDHPNDNLLIDSQCRISEAIVSEIWEARTGYLHSQGASGHDHSFHYKSSEWVMPTNGFGKTREACEPGIHFYFDRDRAVNH